MPRGPKSSKLAKSIELLKSAVSELTAFQDEYTGLLIENAKYQELKPMLEKIAGSIEPSTTMATPGPSEPSDIKEKAQRRTKQIKSNMETNSNVEPKETEPNHKPEERTQLEGKKPGDMGKKEGGSYER